jgi:hypothetical protein
VYFGCMRPAGHGLPCVYQPDSCGYIPVFVHKQKLPFASCFFSLLYIRQRLELKVVNWFEWWVFFIGVLVWSNFEGRCIGRVVGMDGLGWRGKWEQ